MTVVGNPTDTAVAEGSENKEESVEVKQTESAEESNLFDKLDESTQAPTDGTKADEIKRSSMIPGHLSNEATERVRINGETYKKSDLEITPEEKAAFIDSLISGKRYKHEYSIFGGKIHVVIRNRSSEETHAMYSYIRRVLSKNGDNEGMNIVEGDMAYIPLVAQIDEINGTKFPEMKHPLSYEESDGKEIPPGWLEDFKAWKAKPEGLTSALISFVQLFEYKYWTMVKEAANKNFWNSDTFIEE